MLPFTEPPLRGEEWCLRKHFFSLPPPHQCAYIHHCTIYAGSVIMISSSPPPLRFSRLCTSQPSLGNAADWGAETAAIRILRASALVTKWPAYCTLVKKQIPYRYDMKWFLTCLLLGRLLEKKNKGIKSQMSLEDGHNERRNNGK